MTEHQLVTEGLGVDHLRLILGASMGCMKTWMWGESYPGMADALMALACMPVEIGGRNRAWRYMILKAITEDPGYAGRVQEPASSAEDGRGSDVDAGRDSLEGA